MDYKKAWEELKGYIEQMNDRNTWMFEEKIIPPLVYGDRKDIHDDHLEQMTRIEKEGGLMSEYYKHKDCPFYKPTDDESGVCWNDSVNSDIEIFASDPACEVGFKAIMEEEKKNG